MDAYTFDFPDNGKGGLDLTPFTRDTPLRYDKYRPGNPLLLYVPEFAQWRKGSDSIDIWAGLERGYCVGYANEDGQTFLMSGAAVDATHWGWLPPVEPSALIDP